MAPSILPTWRTSQAETADAFAVSRLERFYAWQSLIYDWTRPQILFGRGALQDGLPLNVGDRVLDVGCGTGWALPRLVRRGARVTAIECAHAMLARARRRAARLRCGERQIVFDQRPYGSHDAYRGAVDAIIFSYSLSMMPPFEPILASARLDLRQGGSIAVVDFLDATNAATGAWLTSCHVALGDARLRQLAGLFPQHRVDVRRTPLWTYYLFWGTAD
jgi:S-adenosylmethionine-diacylgycerolhomoserine-N-methlytransferase